MEDLQLINQLHVHMTNRRSDRHDFNILLIHAPLHYLQESTTRINDNDMKQYVTGAEESFDALKLVSGDIPQPGKGEIQIKFHAVSLNYRDLIIAKKTYPLPNAPNTVPASDGAGEVTALGEGVVGFKVGDKVSPNFTQDHFGGNVTKESIRTALGGSLDGCLREYGCFRAISCVKLSDSLSYEEWATLPCAGLTAWNSLTGNADAPLIPGQWVLVEGTGGVSIFGAQIALASGCRVIITSSSDAKLSSAIEKITTGRDSERKRLFGINYVKTPEWGVEALKITKDEGVDHIVEVGGEATLAQAFECIKMGGQIGVIGFVGGAASASIGGGQILGAVLTKNVRIRGILIGSVAQFKDFVTFVQTTGIKPVVDKVFEFEDAKLAYEYQWSQKHLGKVVVKVA